jgi:L-lactate dehydrogenase complex protein LldF
MKVKSEQFREVAREELGKRHTRAHLDFVGLVIRERRKATMGMFPDPEAALELGRAIRAESIARLPELLEEFEKNAKANGAVVIWARDGEEANDHILRIARERNVKLVTKGKSMVTEEAGLNETLLKSGLEVFETDLGEFIIQLLGRPPFHIQGPAANVPVQEICDLFLEKGIMKEPTLDPVELGQAARVFLRDKFHHVEMGITGVNFAVAETGTIINVENEGNIRLTKSSPRIQVSVMSLEKVVPTMQDAMHMLRLLCRNCSGQKIAAYVSMDSGPNRGAEVDGPAELFIVILDNGRSGFYRDPEAREVLRCIRCGACMGECPVYWKIGGYPYGWVYSGPLGQFLNPLMLGQDRTQDLYRACTLCGGCQVVCPAGIDHPKMFLSYRARDAEGDPTYRAKGRPWPESRVIGMFTWAAKRRWRWDLGIRALRPFVNRRAEHGFIRAMKGPFEGWFRSRDFPTMAGETFHERMKKREKRKGGSATQPS